MGRSEEGSEECGRCTEAQPGEGLGTQAMPCGGPQQRATRVRDGQSRRASCLPRPPARRPPQLLRWQGQALSAPGPLVLPAALVLAETRSSEMVEVLLDRMASLQQRHGNRQQTS